MNLDKQQKTRLAIALGAVVALVLGFAVLNKSDSDTTANANSAMNGPGGQGGQMPPGGPGGTGATGGMGQGGPPNGAQGGPPGGGQGGPGQMEPVTGQAATKAKDAAEAKVNGTAQQVMKNPRGDGYVVIVQSDDNTVTIVELSDKYKVTSAREMQGGPPQGGQPPAQGGDGQGTTTQ